MRLIEAVRQPNDGRAVGLGAGLRVRVFDEVDCAVAELAGDFRSHVLLRCPDLLLAVRTVCIEGKPCDLFAVQVELERLVAEFALDPFAGVLAVNTEFLLAMRTADVKANWMNVNHAFVLFKSDIFRRGDGFGLQVGVQQGAAAPAVDEQTRHVCVAVRAGAPGPCGHRILRLMVTRCCLAARAEIISSGRPVWTAGTRSRIGRQLRTAFTVRYPHPQKLMVTESLCLQTGESVKTAKIGSAIADGRCAVNLVA